MKFFNMDGPFYRWGSELADVMILSFYWLICSLPIITLGASTTALYYVYGKKIRGEDAYVTKDFFKSFKQNFKQSIPITIVLVIILISGRLYYEILMAYQGKAPALLTGLAIFVILEGMAMSIYCCAILSRFHMTIRAIFLTAFVLLHKHILKTIMILASLLAIELSIRYFPPVMIVLPGLTVAATSYFLQQIFTEHIKASEIAETSEETQIQSLESITAEEKIMVEEEEKQDNDFLKYL